VLFVILVLTYAAFFASLAAGYISVSVPFRKADDNRQVAADDNRQIVTDDNGKAETDDNRQVEKDDSRQVKEDENRQVEADENEKAVADENEKTEADENKQDLGELKEQVSTQDVTIPGQTGPKLDETALEAEGWEKAELQFFDAPVWIKATMDGDIITGFIVKALTP